MRAEAEAFLHGFALCIHGLHKSGITFDPAIWEDARQVAFLLYPPFDPPSDSVKVRKDLHSDD